MPPPVLEARLTRVLVKRGTRVGYSAAMSTRRIDRDAWATLVRSLIVATSRGNKSAFARKVGVTTRTLDRWLDAQVDVSEQSVRAVAEGLGKSPLEMLVAVGYYTTQDVQAIAANLAAIPVDEELEAVRTDPRIPDDLKTRMIRLILDRRASDLAQTRRLLKELGAPPPPEGDTR